MSLPVLQDILDSSAVALVELPQADEVQGVDVKTGSVFNREEGEYQLVLGKDKGYASDVEPTNNSDKWKESSCKSVRKSL